VTDLPHTVPAHIPLARIPLAGVIGHPIAHSRSPALHGHWLRRYGIKGHYIPMDIAPQDLPEALRLLPRLGFVGINVTIPHKETVMALADVVTDRAALIGAANTLISARMARSTPTTPTARALWQTCATMHRIGCHRLRWRCLARAVRRGR